MTTRKHTIELGGGEQAHIHAILKKGKHNARVINRARILLYRHNGIGKDAIASGLGIGRSTVRERAITTMKAGLIVPSTMPHAPDSRQNLTRKRKHTSWLSPAATRRKEAITGRLNSCNRR
jgi:hypothetical protein